MKPVFIGWREFSLGEVADDCGHGHLTHAPRGAKVELEAIVFDVLVARVALERTETVSNQKAVMGVQSPHRLHLTSGEMAGHSLGDGRLFCNA